MRKPSSSLSGQKFDMHPFAQCDCSFFVKNQSQKNWTRADNYVLKTQVLPLLEQVRPQGRIEINLWQEQDRGDVEAKIFYRKQLRYSFSFSLEDGEFSQARQPPGLTLRWSGPRRRVLLVEQHGVRLRIVPHKGWFPKETKMVWIDLESTAQVINVKGEVSLKRWTLKGDRSLPLRKGMRLKPGCNLQVADDAMARVQLDTGEIKTFLARTIVLFQKRPLLVALEEGARIRHERTSKGMISIRRAGKSLLIAPGEEVPIHIGDLVHTAVEGRAEILLSNGRKIRIDPLCYVFTEDIIKYVTLARLMEGRVKAIPAARIF